MNKNQVSGITGDAKKILRFLSRKKKVLSPLLIMTHDYPDPDAIAGAYALQFLASRRYGIQSRIAYGGMIGRMENRTFVRLLKIPVTKLKPADFKRYENIALIDTQPTFHNNSFPNNRRATIVIDQHESSAPFNTDFSVINVNCGATSVILAQALLLSKLEIPSKLATALAYGILSDTSNLYRCRQVEALRIYRDISALSDLKTLARIQNPPRMRKFFVTLSRGIQNARMRRKLIVSHLQEVENPDLVAQVADFLLSYRKASWVLCTGRYRGKLRISLRLAKAAAQAGEILRDIMPKRSQAGGHDTIAGGSLKVKSNASDSEWNEAEAALASKLQKRLRLPARADFYYPFRQNPMPSRNKPAVMVKSS